MARSAELKAEIKAMELIERTMSRAQERVVALAGELPIAAGHRVAAWFTQSYELPWLDKPVGDAADSAPAARP